MVIFLRSAIFLKAQFQTFCKYRFLLVNLITKDLKLKYRRSVLGILWSILNPLLMMLVISAVFARLFKVQVENFPIYFLTGSTLFSFFSDTTSSSLTSVLSSSSLIKKVYIPKYIFPLEKCLFGFINFLFSLIAVAIMFVVFKFKVSVTVLLFPIPVLYTLIFSIGISFILSALSIFFRDIIHLYGVLLTAWNYWTPIVYPYEMLGDTMKKILLFNPLFHYVTYFRDVTMYGVVPGIKENFICIAMAVGTFLIGLLFFKKKQDKFILYI